MYWLLSPSPRLRRMRRGPKHDPTGGRSKCQPKTRGSKQHSKISATDHQRKMEPARDARPEATPQHQRLTQVTDRQQKIESEVREPQAEAPPQNHQRNQFDSFSIKDY